MSEVQELFRLNWRWGRASRGELYVYRKAMGLSLLSSISMQPLSQRSDGLEIASQPERVLKRRRRDGQLENLLVLGWCGSRSASSVKRRSHLNRYRSRDE